jgi:hypothetical protein
MSNSKDTPKFQPVQFTEKEIAMFVNKSCNSIISVGFDASKPDGPLWVNFVVLTDFAKLYIYFWNRAVHSNTSFAIKQRSILYNILTKIAECFNLSIRHNCIINQWVDVRKLLKATKANKMENLYLARYPHHEYDILEIEKIGLEHSKIELEYDILDEEKIKDIIIFSKLMAYQLHGIRI